MFCHNAVFNVETWPLYFYQQGRANNAFSQICCKCNENSGFVYYMDNVENIAQFLFKSGTADTTLCN